MEWRACPNEARAEAADNMAATKDKELRLLYEQKAWGLPFLQSLTSGAQGRLRREDAWGRSLGDSNR